MPDYKAPLRDIQFLFHELLKLEDMYAGLGFEDTSVELFDSILEEGAKFAENELRPLNQLGDAEGLSFVDGKVTAPKGYKEAYQLYCESGWPAMAGDPQYGGQGLPNSMEAAFYEMTLSANMSWMLANGLTTGAIHALKAHGSEQLKEAYLPKLVSGEWTGTMCLTEPHAGTDLSLLKTKAVPNDDGSYQISGTKIFITGGEHDYTDNIIHLVLAKLPDAPAGTKGISLFLVPKKLPENNTANGVSCGSIEHKMGIKTSPTCVMNFDNAQGWLIGGEHNGLVCMFTMMNHARLFVGIHGLSQSQASYQGAVEYALERLQMRSLKGPQQPDKPADSIINHPDVRRMLLTQKALVEGGRALALYTAAKMDVYQKHPDAHVRQETESLVAFLIPIVKGFLTENSQEVTNLGIQVYGGHGYIREWGMEQYVRDARITQLYEGTNGIQALDLVGRKLLHSKFAMFELFLREANDLCKSATQDPQSASAEFAEIQHELLLQWQSLAGYLAEVSQEDVEEIGACSMDFLMYSGYVTLAHFWLWMAQVAEQQLKAGHTDKAFYEGKLMTARFYFERLLPRAQSHAVSMRSGANNLMQMDPEQFAL